MLEITEDLIIHDKMENLTDKIQKAKHFLNHNYERFISRTFGLGLFGSDKLWDSVKPAKAMHLSALGIMPGMQGCGLGSYLCIKIEEMAKEQGNSMLRLNAAPSLRDFYLGKGFEEVHCVNDRFQNPQWYLLEKVLR
jgi:GNAT superfamily N-acetyltransferase